MKVNPFTPGKRLTRPELFSGRSPQLATGLQLLVQAAGGNVRHGLITGDRGIGKSSLSSQLQGIAQGDADHLKLVGTTPEEFPYTFAVGEHVAQRGQAVADVAQGMLRDLHRNLGHSAKRWKVDLEIDLKLFKVALADARQGASTDVSVAFVDEVERIWDQVYRHTSGIVLVVDEVDRVAEEPGVSTFFKVATELMAARGIEHVMLLPVGMVGVQELLKQEHESVARVFEVLHLPLLDAEEAMMIVDLALADTGVGIDPDVNASIASYAGGFPNPVHLIGSEAFEADDDDFIDLFDLELGIQGVVTEKWKEQFDVSYVEAGSGKCREIIKVMAGSDDIDVPSSYICAAMGIKQPQISSNINDLMKRDVIVRSDRGVYRFKDPLFRQYVQYLDIFGDEPIERRPRKRKPH